MFSDEEYVKRHKVPSQQGALYKSMDHGLSNVTYVEERSIQRGGSHRVFYFRLCSFTISLGILIENDKSAFFYFQNTYL